MKAFRIDQGLSRSQLKMTDDRLVICERTQTYKQTNYVDTFGPSWNLLISRETGARLRSGNQWIALTKPFSLFVSAFSVIEFEIQPRAWGWTSVMGLDPTIKVPKGILLLQGFTEVPSNSQELQRLFSRMTRFGDVICDQRNPSAVAARFKNLLVDTFSESVKIQDLCHQLGFHRRVVSRAFKASYGMSAVEYRHRIRIFAVLRMMSQGRSITESIAEAGISEPKQFLIQFKRFMGTVPSEIKILAKKGSVPKAELSQGLES